MILPFSKSATGHRFTCTRGTPLVFLTIARLHWKKDWNTLQALLVLQEQKIDFQYAIIGDGEEYERLVFAAHQLGIGHRVHLPGKCRTGKSNLLRKG
ncbi:MAG: glycosyltransferase [Saprospiraceae bacterium]|nr:glycosyltransferase [Saprospiraceae bacterium]